MRLKLWISVVLGVFLAQSRAFAGVTVFTGTDWSTLKWDQEAVGAFTELPRDEATGMIPIFSETFLRITNPFAPLPVETVTPLYAVTFVNDPRAPHDHMTAEEDPQIQEIRFRLKTEGWGDEHKKAPWTFPDLWVKRCN